MARYLRLLAVCTLVCMLFAGCMTAALTGDNDGTSVARTLTGTINASESAKRAPCQQATEQRYSVIVQSAETKKNYMGETDSSGGFQVNIPESETGDVFMVSIMMPNGQPAGPVLFSQNSSQGSTGLEITGNTSLGAIPFPDDPTAAPIIPGSDADYDDSKVSDTLIARLNNDGVPVGVPDFGRGDDAKGTASEDEGQQIDADQDGLPDDFDADDDGDGTIDDFDDDAQLNPAENDGLNIHFFMNLKIDDVQATAYFSGDAAGIANSLKTDTVITFEVQGQASLGKTITGARIIGPPSPAPAYLVTTTVSTAAPATLWSASSYALQPDGTNHFQQWVVPNDFMNTGDTFTVEITFDDGTVGVYSRMINYVFKSIPKLINVGPPGALATFNGPAVITFDGTQDLVFEWAPPVDDFGMLLVGLPYQFEIFYYDSADQQIDDIDGSATWPSPPTNFDANSQNYSVSGTTLSTVSATGAFSVQLPKELFVNSVQKTDGTTVNVAIYKVDIAAQNNGNNAALMLRLKKN